MWNSKNRRAVVVGGSISGLLTARVLHESFAEVVVLDRDTLADGSPGRKGVPQTGHTHGLLARGGKAMDELFEGLSTELIEQGAPAFDVQDDIHWWVDGRLLAQGSSGMIGLGPSRPMLELAIRRRVVALANVEIRSGHTVIGLTTRPDTGHINGVEYVSDRGPGAIEDVDLVVDATGRSARSRIWLQDAGFQRPAEQRIETQVTYLTRRYRREAHHLDGRAGTSIGSYPGRSRSAFVLAQEDEAWTVTITGRFGATPPTDDQGMLEWVADLDSPDVAAIIREAVPIGEPLKMRYPASTRTRYDQLTNFPQGLLVVGDALCSFNPVYGQGMTVVALEALLLARLLKDGSGDLAAEFFAGAAAVIDVPWSTVAATDLQFPQAIGDRSSFDPARGAYLARLRKVAVQDPVVANAFLRVAQLMDPPTALFAPELLSRVEAGAAS